MVYGPARKIDKHLISIIWVNGTYDSPPMWDTPTKRNYKCIDCCVLSQIELSSKAIYGGGGSCGFVTGFAIYEVSFAGGFCVVTDVI